MRILLLVQYYFPNIQSCGKLMHDLGTALADEGHDVVIAAPDDLLTEPRRISREEGMTVVRVRSGRFRDVPRAVRAWNEWRLPASLWRGAGDFFRDHPCELIVNYSPTILFAPLVRRLKRLWSCRNYLVLRDVFPQWNVDAGLIREGGPVHRFFRHYELMLYDTADVVGVQSKRNLEYFHEQGLAAGLNLEVLHNWVPAEGQELSEPRWRRELGLEERIVYFYGGNLGKAQDPMSLVELADALHHEPRAFVLVAGNGSEAESLEREAERRRLDNIRFLPPVGQADYLGMVAECDVGLIVLNRHLRTHNFPGKLLDYVYLGKPVLAAINRGNDLEDLLVEHEAGLVTWSGDAAATAENALRLLRDGELRGRMGSNCHGLLEEVFSAGRAARQILARS